MTARFTTRAVGGEWFDDNVPCTRACPVLTNAGRYVAAIAAGDDQLAYEIARLPNPFPSICGRVCAAPCEIACRRGSIDQPIAIRALKRFACEGFGVESPYGQEVYAAARTQRADAERACRDHRRRPRGPGVRARSGDLRLPAGGVRSSARGRGA